MKRQTFTLFMILAFLAGFLFHSYLGPKENPIEPQSMHANARDSAEVMKIIFQDFPTAYQKGEESAQNISELFFDYADMVILSSPWLMGDKAIQERFSHLEDFPLGRGIEFNLESYFFIDNKAAWVNVNACEQGGFDKEGIELAPYCDRGSFLLEKRQGVWKIAALRAFEAAK